MPSIFTQYSASRIANYEEGWSSHIDSIASHAAEGASLADLVSRYDAASSHYGGFIAEQFLQKLPAIDLGQFADNLPPQRLAVVNGHYVALPTAPSMVPFFDAIARIVDPEVDCIVEFGCGLGFNLARLRLRLPDAPITYVACEPTEGGRRAAEIIFSADPQARLEVHAFDYAAADLSFLNRFRKIVAFTVHSIEQMPVLGEAFYRALLDANIARCIHLEPVGWQRFPNIAETVITIHRDPKAWQRFTYNFNHNYTFVLEDSHLVNNAAMWSANSGYNTDLLSLVANAVDRGEVALTTVSYDVVGGNPFNPSTLIAWSRTRGGAGAGPLASI